LSFAKILCALKIRHSLTRRLPRPGYPFTLEREESVPGESAPYTRKYYVRMEENSDVFTTLRWFGLGSPFVAVVQPSQSAIASR
jgi:hypothetical protein